jgi:U3 small nucleolar RNA-associated protein 14
VGLNIVAVWRSFCCDAATSLVLRSMGVNVVDSLKCGVRGSEIRTLGAPRKIEQPHTAPARISTHNTAKMPPRIARSNVGSSAKSTQTRPNARNPKKAQRRAMNAFSIAQYENPEEVKLSKNRAGELDPSFNRKRTRDDDDDEGEEDEEDEEGPKRRKRTGGNDSFDEGSDSEGNTWQMGHVDDDDDEDIDSDEAFGESDEERFEGYTFRGSSKNQNQKAKPKKSKRDQDREDYDGEIDLDEGDSADGEEDEDDDLGEDAIDLATALDQYEEDEAEERREARKQKKKQASAFDDSDSEREDVASDGASDLSSDDDMDDEEDRQAQLQDLISSLADKEAEKGKGRRVEVHESAAPDEFGVARKVDLLSFKPKIADEEKKRALKLLRDDKSSKRNDIARKLDAPLPKRAQDKLDRAAANAKANETLERWTDTIKQNRRAE